MFINDYSFFDEDLEHLTESNLHDLDLDCNTAIHDIDSLTVLDCLPNNFNDEIVGVRVFKDDRFFTVRGECMFTGKYKVIYSGLNYTSALTEGSKMRHSYYDIMLDITDRYAGSHISTRKLQECL